MPISFLAKGHIDKRMAEVSERINQGEKVEGKYLTYYLAQEKLSMKSIYGNVTELLLAGVDTVSSWGCSKIECFLSLQALFLSSCGSRSQSNVSCN